MEIAATPEMVGTSMAGENTLMEWLVERTSPTGDPLDTAVVAARLLNAVFTPGSAGPYSFAAGGGLDAVLEQGLAASSPGQDPLTGQLQVTIADPVGGWVWTADGDGLPETVYGVALVDAASDEDVLASQLFAEPILVDSIGQQISSGKLQFRLPLFPLGPINPTVPPSA